MEVIPAERIYILGSTTTCRNTESIFISKTHTANFIEHLYVLVLYSLHKTERKNNLQDKLEKACHSILPATIVVLDVNQFNIWLTEGNVFAYQVQNFALLIFENLATTLAKGKIIDEMEIKRSNEICYCQGLNKVQEFTAGANLFLIRRQNNMAAFMLHQATEHALLTILSITTGLRVNTHNLDKLLRYCSMGTYIVNDVFPRREERDKRIFQLLQSAYVGARYTSSYTIASLDLLGLRDKVDMLKDQISKIYKEDST